eukprot:5039434-Amphidinium_carterae.2
MFVAEVTSVCRYSPEHIWLTGPRPHCGALACGQASGHPHGANSGCKLSFLCSNQNWAYQCRQRLGRIEQAFHSAQNSWKMRALVLNRCPVQQRSAGAS